MQDTDEAFEATIFRQSEDVEDEICEMRRQMEEKEW